MSYIAWDPDPVLFMIPLFERPIVWYGALFAVGFLLAVFVGTRVVREDLGDLTKEYADRCFGYVFVGTIIGARFGHLLFYQPWKKWLLDPMFMISVWEGGLASHGAVVGILAALYIFYLKMRGKVEGLTFWRVVDYVVLVIPLAAVCIRLGNFVNQELVGTVTSVPWAVVFGHPADGREALPRHPVQLYEAFCYLVTFCVMYGFKAIRKVHGRLTGIFFIMIFGARFIMEFFKEGQSIYDKGPFLVGQYLSLPLILFGFYLLFRGKNGRSRDLKGTY
ncbi:MAG: Phosphatidylglycerol--prolipoprotein diacylglyceryl transferase [Chlamydiia bacterium]|nr:Phosphatidylglycerol--prolipoprotein diacylglyceryl transferase [Chlamydiia bacterium]MCH9615850.1 Phosphatidylglycerol--prolipoprotein diacylglyceryl transferase [Chlamydiia bacterium]MCH9628747.1 Phosphatidylglycerol--prolipoprotein diacylglyceryl transferase [Chlamydiia bacterium]